MKKRYDAGDGELHTNKRDAERRLKDLEEADVTAYRKAAKAAKAVHERKVELLGERMAGAYVAPDPPPERAGVTTVELEELVEVVRDDGAVEAVLETKGDAADHVANLERQVASGDWQGPAHKWTTRPVERRAAVEASA